MNSFDLFITKYPFTEKRFKKFRGNRVNFLDTHKIFVIVLITEFTGDTKFYAEVYVKDFEIRATGQYNCRRDAVIAGIKQGFEILEKRLQNGV